MPYIVEGPIEIGNLFGFSGNEVPVGKFAVVRDGEYADGGHGPSTVTGRWYATRARAEEVLREHLA
jgi:hypothetical protein